jgi:hypothetical protein
VSEVGFRPYGPDFFLHEKKLRPEAAGKGMGQTVPPPAEGGGEVP